MVGHWLTTVDVSSVLLHEQQGLFVLVAAAFAVANNRFPTALPHEPSCPLSQEADMVLLPSPLGGCLHRMLGTPLPLAVAPRGMPRLPRLHLLITRGAQLSAELHSQLSCVVLGGGWQHLCAASSFLTGPLTTGWATHCTSCWGAVPLGLARRGGSPSVPYPFVWATASDDICADCSWAVAAVRPPT
jgi:hypothetical protein